VVGFLMKSEEGGKGDHMEQASYTRAKKVQIRALQTRWGVCWGEGGLGKRVPLAARQVGQEMVVSWGKGGGR